MKNLSPEKQKIYSRSQSGGNLAIPDKLWTKVSNTGSKKPNFKLNLDIPEIHQTQADYDFNLVDSDE